MQSVVFSVFLSILIIATPAFAAKKPKQTCASLIKPMSLVWPQRIETSFGSGLYEIKADVLVLRFSKDLSLETLEKLKNFGTLDSKPLSGEAIKAFHYSEQKAT